MNRETIRRFYIKTDDEGTRKYTYARIGKQASSDGDAVQESHREQFPCTPEPENKNNPTQCEEMPKASDWMSASQKQGHPLIANEIYIDTCEWLKKHKCGHLAPKQQIEQYAMSAARWIQCEQAISEYGLIAKHPVNGVPIASPYVSMAQSFSKQTYNLWAQIFAIVRENSAEDCSVLTPQGNLMDRLLAARKGK